MRWFGVGRTRRSKVVHLVKSVSIHGERYHEGWHFGALGTVQCLEAERVIDWTHLCDPGPAGRVTCKRCLKELRREMRMLVNLDGDAFYAGEA